jgi:iron complex transport system permease protein
MMRLWLGSDHRLLLPASGLFGAFFLIMADWLARSAFSGESFQTQIPVGVITALIGGPFFVYLLKRGARKVLW